MFLYDHNFYNQIGQVRWTKSFDDFPGMWALVSHIPAQGSTAGTYGQFSVGNPYNEKVKWQTKFDDVLYDKFLVVSVNGK